MKRALACILAVWPLAPSMAQTWGRIGGEVLDVSGLPVPSVMVTATDPSTGERRSAQTSANGFYSIAGLPIGTYSLQAVRDGFGLIQRPNIRVGLDEPVRVDFVLAPRMEKQSIEVNGHASESTGGGSSTGLVMRGRQLADLPLNGRDYAQMTLLAPGALVRSSQLADLSFNGLHSSHNQFSIDGIDGTRVDMPYVANGSERGARLLTGSVDSIAEFHVETGNYAAEYGWAAGAYISIATKSGTNQTHGSVFDYARNAVFDSRNFFNTEPAPKAPFRYQNFGANLSGPLRKDATFYFANYEGSRQGAGVVGSGTVPASGFRQSVLETSPALAPVLTMMPEAAAPTSDPRVRLYSTTGTSSIREDTGSLKLDHRFTARNSAFVRVNLNDSRVRGPLFAVQSNALGLTDSQDVPVRTSNVAINDQHVFTSRLINGFTTGMQRVETRLITDQPQQPLISVTGFTIAAGSRGRSASAYTSYQIGNQISYATGSHTVKAGMVARNIRLNQQSSAVTLLSYTSLEDFRNNRAAAASIVGGNPGSATWAYRTGVWVQDSWLIRRDLSLDYGLRYDLFEAPFDPQNLARPFDAGTGALAVPGTPYFETNRLNIGPRFGAAWQALSYLTVRAGYGVFYQAYPAGYGAIAGNTLPGTSTVLAQQYPGLGYPFSPRPGDGTPAKPSVIGFEPNKPDLYAEQWSLILDWGLGRNGTVRTSYLGNRGLHLRRTVNLNLLDPRTGRQSNSNFSTISLETAGGNSSYSALQLTWTRRLSARFNGEFDYVWSHALDDVADPATGIQPQPQDMNNFRAEWGNGSGDSRHRFGYGWVYELPGSRSRVLGGWKLASIARIRTGIPSTVTIGTNTYGNGNLTNQRPDAVAGVSPYAEPKTVSVWLRPSAFRMPAVGSFGNLGRNTVYGPGFGQIDVSLSKEARFEHVTAQFRVEAFNVANHPNPGQPNTVFGTAAFGRILNTAGNTTGPGTARQIQGMLRLSF